MTPQDILAHRALSLGEQDRHHYFEQGYVVVPGFIPGHWLERLRATTHRLLGEASQLSESNEAFDLGPGHAQRSPDVRRIRALVDRDPLYWEFATCPLVLDMVADLVGPDIKFHSSKLNNKRPTDGAQVKWHQDIQAWPHTNYSPLTIGIYLEDVDESNGPLAAIPGSHDGPLYDQFKGDEWTGYISDQDMTGIDLRTAQPMCGPAGTLCVVNCRTVHGSAANVGTTARPMVLLVYAAADALTYSAAPTPTSHTNEIVRGKPARVAHVDPRPGMIPPEWDKIGYGSIFTAQHTG
jgi:hypothetical protein